MATLPPPPSPVYLPLVLRNRHACSDQYEPNDTTGDASPIEIGESIRANFCASDPDDYYTLSVRVASVAIIIELTDIQDDTDLDLYLYDEELIMIAFSNQGSHGVDERITHSLGVGTYYIRVYPFDVPPDSTRWYDLQVDRQ